MKKPAFPLGGSRSASISLSCIRSNDLSCRFADGPKPMADPHILNALRIPSEALIALDYRPLHFAMQPYHHLVRLLHVLSMGAFFGGIGLLDLRLMGVRGAVPLKAFADHVLPWLYATFAVSVVTGIGLFLYSPVQVGSHAYFTPKLILIALGVANAAVFHRTSYLHALAAEGHLPRSARWAGAMSLLFWTGVVACACLNVEAAPKVLLR
jgi:hypothetical protein